MGGDIVFIDIGFVGEIFNEGFTAADVEFISTNPCGIKFVLIFLCLGGFLSFVEIFCVWEDSTSGGCDIVFFIKSCAGANFLFVFVVPEGCHLIFP